LRLRFREDADHWAEVSHKILRTDWTNRLSSARNRCASESGRVQKVRQLSI
jgi:hypothetical protein